MEERQVKNMSKKHSQTDKLQEERKERKWKEMRKEQKGAER